MNKYQLLSKCNCLTNILVQKKETEKNCSTKTWQVNYIYIYIYIYYEFIHLETAHGYNGTKEHGYNVFRVSAKLCKHNLFRNLKSRGHKFHMSRILEVL